MSSLGVAPGPGSPPPATITSLTGTQTPALSWVSTVVVRIHWRYQGDSGRRAGTHDRGEPGHR